MAEDVPPYYITDTVRVEIKYFLQNNNASNVFHVGYDTPPGLADLADLASTISDWLTTDWSPIVSSEWSATQILLTDEGGPTGKRLSYAIEPVVAGTLVGQAMPGNATLAIKEDTGNRGRGRNGRWFWVGLDESTVDGNTVSSAGVAAILAALDALNAAIGALSAFTGMVVPHSFQTTGGVKHHLNPATSAPVIGFAATDNLIDSQKDRLPAHKKHKRHIP